MSMYTYKPSMPNMVDQMLNIKFEEIYMYRFNLQTINFNYSLLEGNVVYL